MRAQEARWWRDACISCFGQVSRLQIPSGYAAPANSMTRARRDTRPRS
ncbi:uncharacterized protein SOCE26_038570 [Sorangium cellulosum]|uniref:Uncharacterized protein n=1 Tax=Sorangium cellulosum TaxID=56 RepID=A0A2L0ET14_SORCE|nr:uncharacterized protein SOCE26_038570 [Sorangium cellulosum]